MRHSPALRQVRRPSRDELGWATYYSHYYPMLRHHCLPGTVASRRLPSILVSSQLQYGRASVISFVPYHSVHSITHPFIHPPVLRSRVCSIDYIQKSRGIDTPCNSQGAQAAARRLQSPPLCTRAATRSPGNGRSCVRLDGVPRMPHAVIVVLDRRGRGRDGDGDNTRLWLLTLCRRRRAGDCPCRCRLDHCRCNSGPWVGDLDCCRLLLGCCCRLCGCFGW
jgi:hypothetical protein